MGIRKTTVSRSFRQYRLPRTMTHRVPRAVIRTLTNVTKPKFLKLKPTFAEWPKGTTEWRKGEFSTKSTFAEWPKGGTYKDANFAEWPKTNPLPLKPRLLRSGGK